MIENKNKNAAGADEWLLLRKPGVKAGNKWRPNWLRLLHNNCYHLMCENLIVFLIMKILDYMLILPSAKNLDHLSLLTYFSPNSLCHYI